MHATYHVMRSLVGEHRRKTDRQSFDYEGVVFPVKIVETVLEIIESWSHCVEL